MTYASVLGNKSSKDCFFFSFCQNALQAKSRLEEELLKTVALPAISLLKACSSKNYIYRWSFHPECFIHNKNSKGVDTPLFSLSIKYSTMAYASVFLTQNYHCGNSVFSLYLSSSFMWM